jgi:hypothetical protein
MVDARKVVEYDAKPCLEFLSEFPRVRYGRSGIVKDVADEMESCNLARDGSAVDEKRCNDDVANLYSDELASQTSLRLGPSETSLRGGLGMLKTKGHAASEFATLATQGS